MIWINKFPLPHSVNNSLMPIISKGGINKKTGRPYYKGRMIKTKQANDYTQRCLMWKKKNYEAVTQLRKTFQSIKDKCEKEGRVFALQLDTYFVFHVERLITKNNKSENLDLDNRIKPAWDAIKTILGIDDKHFYATRCEKVTTKKKEDECTIIKITLTTPKTVEQIYQLMPSPQKDS